MKFKREDAIHKAVELFLSPDSDFSIINLAEQLGVSANEIYEVYTGKDAVLADFYALVAEESFRLTKAIPDFHEFTLAEKLTAVVHTSFDLLDEQRDFVEQTFKSHFLDSIYYPKVEKAVRQQLKDLVNHDSGVSAYIMITQIDLVYDFYFKEYTHLLRFWLKDRSEGKEKTYALTDKLTSFVEEVLYNKVVDKGFDLAKYFLQNNIIKLPFGLNDWFKG